MIGEENIKKERIETEPVLRVFISYSTRDKEHAIRVKCFLEKSNIDVIIDRESIHPGGDIKSFISNSILNSEATISIVSKNSLLSSWVAWETIQTLNKESDDKRKFIPLFIEDSFMDRDFTGKALDEIDKEINQIVEIFKIRLNKRTGFADLYGEFTRYLSLRNNIDEIVGRLRESLSIDITNENYEAAMSKIVRYLTSVNH